MEVENYCKKWEDNEINELIKEINNLTDIDTIVDNHKRTLNGITTRIQKILDDNKYDSKIQKKHEISLKYFSKNNKTNSGFYDEIYNNLYNFHNVSQICVKYKIQDKNKVVSILNNFLKKDKIDTAKKLRINLLLKSIEDDNETNNKEIKKDNLKKNNKKNNIDNFENEQDTNTLIKLLINEIRDVKIDIKDVRSRLKIISKKIDSFEFNKINEKNSFDKKKIIILHDDIEHDDIEHDDTEHNDNEQESFDKKKTCEQNNKNIIDDELERELEKFL
jgi:hypothetical protein